MVSGRTWMASAIAMWRQRSGKRVIFKMSRPNALPRALHRQPAIGPPFQRYTTGGRVTLTERSQGSGPVWLVQQLHPSRSGNMSKCTQIVRTLLLVLSKGTATKPFWMTPCLSWAQESVILRLWNQVDLNLWVNLMQINHIFSQVRCHQTKISQCFN